MELSLTVLNQVIIMFLLIVVGFISKKANVINDCGTKQISAILVTIVTPAVLIDSFQSVEFSNEKLKNLGIALLLSILVHIIGIVICHFVYKKDTDKNKIHKVAAVYSNCGFMGIPLLYALEPLYPGCLFYGAAYLAVFNAMVWSCGLFVYTKGSEGFSLKKLILNPGIIGVAIGLLLYVTQLPIPKLGLDTVSFLADLNTPLAMLLLGAYLAKVDFTKVFNNIHLYTVSFLRLFVIPIIAVFIFKLLKVDPTIWVTVIVVGACPSATITAIFAEKFDMDTAYASQIVAVNTVFSIFTIPFVVFLNSFIM